MKYLNAHDLTVLIKLVNQSMDQLQSTEDLAQVMRRQDRDYKCLPPEALNEAAVTTSALTDAARKMKVIRDRLVRELGETMQK